MYFMTKLLTPYCVLKVKKKIIWQKLFEFSYLYCSMTRMTFVGHALKIYHIYRLARLKLSY